MLPLRQADPRPPGGTGPVAPRRLLHSPAMRAAGTGIATISARHGGILEVWYRDLSLGAADGATIELTAAADAERDVRFEVTTTEIDLDAPPAGVADAYLRLHLLSGRLIRPRGCNLDGVFGALANVVWTSHGPCPVPDFQAAPAAWLAGGDPARRTLPAGNQGP